jgi:protein SCO1/2
MTGRFAFFTRVLALVMMLASVGGLPAFADEDILSDIDVAFELVASDGKVVTYNNYRGRNVLLTFGFTHCHHICPTIAANMARAIKESGKNAAGIFVSVDTERDTPEITNDYAHRFGEAMVGLGGSYQQVAEAANNFNVTFVVTKSQDNYTVQHTPSIFLISPDGKLVEIFAMNTPVETIARAMR